MGLAHSPNLKANALWSGCAARKGTPHWAGYRNGELLDTAFCGTNHRCRVPLRVNGPAQLSRSRIPVRAYSFVYKLFHMFTVSYVYCFVCILFRMYTVSYVKNWWNPNLF
jgi:hypothetical protein